MTDATAARLALPMDLARAAAAAAALRSELRPMLDPDDDKLWLDTVEGETDLIELIVAVEEQAARDESDISYIKQREAQLQARRTRLETRVKNARRAIVSAMQTAEVPRIDQPDITISVAKGSQYVDVYDAEMLPPGTIRTVHQIDKQEIAKRLKAGEAVPGAKMERGPERLQVRRT